MATAEYCSQIVSEIGELHKRIKLMQGKMLREYHISLIEYHILIFLMNMHSISQNELAEALDVDKSLVSRQIRSLEQKGLLTCSADPECRRRKILLLNEAAFELIPKLEEIHRLSLERIFDGVDDDKLREFQLILEGLVSKI